MTKILGYRYCIYEFIPLGDKSTEHWEQIRYLDHRDNLSDANKILEVLYQTDINYTSYGIVLKPVYAND